MELGDDEPIEFKINHRYAKEYEIRKRKEELTKLKEKYERPGLASEDLLSDSSSSEEEDEYGELITPEVDAQIMKTITAIRAKDPEVYNSQANFFADEEIEKARKQWQVKQKKRKSEAKPIHLKDYRRQILLRNDDDDNDDNDDNISTTKLNKKVELTPLEEEQKLKEEFKAVTSTIITDDSGDDDDFFIQRAKTAEEIKAEEEDYQKFLLENMVTDNSNNEDQMKIWKNFKENPNIDEDEAFLMEYILNRGWIDKDSSRIPTYDELVAEHNENEEDEFDEAVDNFESKYNFRFEEDGSTKIMTYSRNVEGSMRRVDNKRKMQRQDREERKAEEKRKKIEEIKRFKNLKKKEIYEKLQKIKEITGNESVGFDEIDLEEDFNPEKYDDKMRKVFDEEFYSKQTEDDKPDWDNDIEINDIVGQNKEKRDSANKKSNDFLMDADYLPGGKHYDEASHNKSKKKIAKESRNKAKKKFDEYLDEYYQLDYEDIIDDIPVRFKYRQVKPTSFGLTPTEILLADDKDLNEFVSLKKYAPYRSDDVVEKDMKKYSKKKRLREFRKKIEDNINNK